MTTDFRLGAWQDVLGDVECDSLITDPPYGERTHEGHNASTDTVGFERKLDYKHWTPDDVHEFVAHWNPRTRGWIVAMTSHDLIPAWEAAFAEVGRYAFAPIPYVDFGKGPRVLGDGSASWTVYIMTARPRSQTWLDSWREQRSRQDLPRSLPGAYLRAKGDVVWEPRKKSKRIGGKPLGLMRAVVIDYSDPGGIVCDPLAGHATTLRAALELGRKPIGAEQDETIWSEGLARLRAPVAMDLFGPTGPVQPRAEQADLFEG